MSTHPFVKRYNTTAISFILGVDESGYIDEVKQLAVWCSQNNLELNMLKKMNNDDGSENCSLNGIITDPTIASHDVFECLPLHTTLHCALSPNQAQEPVFTPATLLINNPWKRLLLLPHFTHLYSFAHAVYRIYQSNPNFCFNIFHRVIQWLALIIYSNKVLPPAGHVLLVSPFPVGILFLLLL